MKSIVGFSATGYGEYYQSPLVQEVMGIKILRWSLTTKTLSLRQVQGSQAINHWKPWKHKYKLALFSRSSWSTHNSSVRISSISAFNQTTYTPYNRAPELPITLSLSLCILLHSDMPLKKKVLMHLLFLFSPKRQNFVWPSITIPAPELFPLLTNAVYPSFYR